MVKDKGVVAWVSGVKSLARAKTLGDLYGPAMQITDQQEADEYLDALIRDTMEHGRTYMEAMAIEKSNLGYFAGYYDHETRLRVERLFKCAHPIFGPAANGAPTAKEAFDAGRKIGKMSRKRKR